jgi:hypothetical protein
MPVNNRIINTQAINTKESNAKLLVNALRANGLFSLLSGLLMLVLQDTLASWFGQINPLYFAGLGVGLMVFSGRLLYLAGPGKLLRLEAKVIIGSDIGWVVGSIVLLALFFASISFAGVVATLLVSVVLAGLRLHRPRGWLKQTKTVEQLNLQALSI